MSTCSTGRRVSFNESALYEKESKTQDKGRRYRTMLFTKWLPSITQVDVATQVQIGGGSGESSPYNVKSFEARSSLKNNLFISMETWD